MGVLGRPQRRREKEEATDRKPSTSTSELTPTRADTAIAKTPVESNATRLAMYVTDIHGDQTQATSMVSG